MWLPLLNILGIKHWFKIVTQGCFDEIVQFSLNFALGRIVEQDQSSVKTNQSRMERWEDGKKEKQNWCKQLPAINNSIGIKY